VAGRVQVKALMDLIGMATEIPSRLS